MSTAPAHTDPEPELPDRRIAVHSAATQGLAAGFFAMAALASVNDGRPGWAVLSGVLFVGFAAALLNTLSGSRVDADMEKRLALLRDAAAEQALADAREEAARWRWAAAHSREALEDTTGTSGIAADILVRNRFAWETDIARTTNA